MSPFARDRVCRREWCSQPCQERLGSSSGWAAGGWGRRRGAVLALCWRSCCARWEERCWHAASENVTSWMLRLEMLICPAWVRIAWVYVPVSVQSPHAGVRARIVPGLRRAAGTRSWERASATPALRGASALGHGRKLLPRVLLRWPGCPPSRGCTSSFPTYHACLSIFSLCLFVVD